MGPDFRIVLPLRDRAKNFVNAVTHEPLHVAEWTFAWTCTLITSTKLFNFKLSRSRSQGFFVCMISAATCGCMNMYGTLTTSRSLLNIKVKGQALMGFCAFFVCMIPQALLSLERGFYLFVLYTNLFTIKIIAVIIPIIVLPRIIKFMIIKPEIKIICTSQLLIVIVALRQ